MNAFIEAFLPLAVAINIPGILPLFIGLTEGMTPGARRRLVVKALTTAFVVALLILFAGDVIFQTLGITLDDLRVGGGLVLLILSITDLLFGDFKRRTPGEDEPEDSIGVVPLGIPLVVGPGAITTILVAQQEFGYFPTLGSLTLNLALVLVVFFYGPALLERLGKDASQAIAKVASLFLTAIAVAMIHAGVRGMIIAG
ncbi:MAG: MarC family protein [Bacteroidota bacterium]